MSKEIEKRSTSIVLRDIEKINALDAITHEYETSMAKCENKFQMTFITAEAMKMLRESITTDMMASIMTLMNSRIGFATDRDPSKGYVGKTYAVETVKNVVIEMTLRGLSMVGNQVNIISSNGYITKEGFTYLLRDKVPGLSDLDIRYDVPNMTKEGAIVHCSASWKIHGACQSYEADIPIRVNAGMGADAVLGKAERKMKCRIYNKITGSNLSDGDVTDGSGIQGDYIDIPAEEAPEKPASKSEGLADRIKARKTANTPEAPQHTPEAPKTAPEPETTPSREDLGEPKTPVDEEGKPLDPEADVKEAEALNGEADGERAALVETINELRKYKPRTFTGYVSEVCNHPERWASEMSVEDLQCLADKLDASKK